MVYHLDTVPEVEDQFPQVLVRGSDHRGPEEHVGEDTGLLTQAVLVPPVVLVQPQAEFLSSDINTVRKPLLRLSLRVQIIKESRYYDDNCTLKKSQKYRCQF